MWDDIAGEFVFDAGPGAYTDEEAQDAVGLNLDDGTVGEIVFTYDDGTPLISGVVQDGEIDHDSLNGAGTLDTEAEIEPAIDTLANLTSVQGQTISLSGDLTVESASLINQDLTTDASPTLANLYVPNAGFIGISGADGWTFDSTNGDISTTSNVGIGTTSPGQKLVVGNDIGGSAFTNPEGRIAAGNTDGLSGYDMGEDSNNRGWMVWQNTGDYIEMGSKVGGALYQNSLVLKSGKVGINKTGPDKILEVNTNGISESVRICHNCAAGSCGVYTDLYMASAGAIFYIDPYGNVPGDGSVYVDGDLTADSYSDNTPFFEGDALSQILNIKSKNVELDHNSLPDFVHKTAETPKYEEVPLIEISPSEAIGTVYVEQAKTEKKYQIDEGTGELVITEEKILLGYNEVQNGYKLEDGEVVPNITKEPIYDTEMVPVEGQLLDGYWFDEDMGKVYEEAGDGMVYKKDGVVYQEVYIGTETEERRDLGASISMNVVAIQQLYQLIQDQQAEIDNLKAQLAGGK